MHAQNLYRSTLKNLNPYSHQTHLKISTPTLLASGLGQKYIKPKSLPFIAIRPNKKY